MENGSHLEKLVTLGKKVTLVKMDNTWKSGSQLEKWVTLKYSSHLEKWVTPGTMCHSWEKGSQLKNIRETWREGRT